jgi:hypothetical protein
MVNKKNKNKKIKNRVVQRQNLRVTAPVVGGAITVPRVPSVAGSGRGILVENTERLVALNTAAAGAVTITRNDLCPASFAWLNGVAQNYSKFRWLMCHIYYLPTCPTSSSGVVAFGLTYDTNDSVVGLTLASVQQVYNSVSGPVWAGFDGTSGLNNKSPNIPQGAMAVPLDASRMDKPWYKYATTTQLGAMSAPEQAMYVPASVLAATDSGVSVNGIGQLMVKYRIELIEPIAASAND